MMWAQFTAAKLRGTRKQIHTSVVFKYCSGVELKQVKQTEKNMNMNTVWEKEANPQTDFTPLNKITFI